VPQARQIPVNDLPEETLQFLLRSRYCTGYLGDIAVPPDGPMDFSAWFEAFLEGQWYAFDPRNNTSRIGRVLVARGRDASDVAITTTFGPNALTSFRVWTDEVRSA